MTDPQANPPDDDAFWDEAVARRLADWTRAVEPVVELSGPAAARRRGERRRARRLAAAAAASATAVAVLAAGTWQLAPWRGGEPQPAPAPIATAPDRSAVPRPIGPDPGLLPWDEELAWQDTTDQTVPEDLLAQWWDNCGWQPLVDDTGGRQRSRYYAGANRAAASFEEVVFENSTQAAQAATYLLTGSNCGVVGNWPDRNRQWADVDPQVDEAGVSLQVLDLAFTSGARGRLYVSWAGERLTVLRVITGHVHPDYSADGANQPDAAAECLRATLRSADTPCAARAHPSVTTSPGTANGGTG